MAQFWLLGKVYHLLPLHLSHQSQKQPLLRIDHLPLSHHLPMSTTQQMLRPVHLRLYPLLEQSPHLPSHPHHYRLSQRRAEMTYMYPHCLQLLHLLHHQGHFIPSWLYQNQMTDGLRVTSLLSQPTAFIHHMIQ